MSTGVGWINGYKCDACHDVIWTTTVDDGVTPMLIACRVSAACRGTMHSTWGKMPYPPAELHIRWEWYTPTGLSGYSAAMRDHIQAGGLDIRQVPCSRGDEAEHTNPPTEEGGE